MKNRTIIGIACVVLALVITFGVAPLVNRMADSRTDIVRMKKNVDQGSQISEDDIEIVTVGKYGLADGTITKKEDVVGKFASCDLKKGDALFPSKVSSHSDSADDVFRTLNGEKQAISITISSFAGGLSGKLENGDIISLVVYESGNRKAIVPAGLTYVKVVTTTTKEGFDQDEVTPNEDGTYELPTTVTLLVNPVQARMLVEYENTGNIHACLVYRGDSKTAQKFLDMQELYFQLLEENPDEPPASDNGETEPPVNDIIQDANDIIWGNTDQKDEGGDA